MVRWVVGSILHGVDPWGGPIELFLKHTQTHIHTQRYALSHTYTHTHTHTYGGTYYKCVLRIENG